MAFLAAFQFTMRNMSLVVRTTGEPTSVVEAVRGEILRLDSSLPIYQVRSMEELMKQQQAGDTIMAKIMAVLAGIALVLAFVGVYGVMAYSVSQRTQEMGIRMALGAQRGNVLAMVIRQGMQLALIGTVAGIALAVIVSRSLSIFLFGVNPYDPLTFGAVALALLASGLAATYFPARRATQVDPVEALRYE